MADESKQKDAYVTGRVWNLWADYWTSKEKKIPPLHYLRRGADDDFIFVSAVSDEELTDFLNTTLSGADLMLTKEGDWWLPVWQWFGHWVTLRATLREPHMVLGRRSWGGGNRPRSQG